jgi:surface antigen
MFQNTILFFYKYRHAFVAPLAIAILTLTSVLVTALGSGTALAAKTYPAANTVSAPMSSANFVTDGFSNLADNTQHALLSGGIHVYRACKTVTTVTARSSEATGRGTVAALRDTWAGVAFVGRGIGMSTMFALRGVGSGIMFGVRGVGSGISFGVRGIGDASLFILRAPGKVIGSAARGQTVSAIIKPADDTTTPVINAETSAAILAKFNTQQQQQISQWMAAQVVANQALDGSVVAGDPNHGGYPAKWDSPVAQDSLVDSWGMYNRECVSYAAWKVYQTYGNMPFWGGVGNANQWLSDARNSGIPTGGVPQVHSVAISMHGYYGHAMWVEKVSGDMVYVSQYNYDLHGHYSEMWVNASQFTYIYFK